MAKVVLLDAGPLVAFLDRREREHERVVGVMQGLPAPLVTVEPVLTEACFLLRGVPGGARAVLQLVRDGLLVVPFRVADEAQALEELLQKYADVPMSLADACLVRAAELHRGARVFTLDSDFHVYRLHRRRPVPLVGWDRAR